MPKLTQDTRLLELITPLGKDALLIRHIQGREGISQLYSFEIDAFAPNEREIDFAAIVGQPVCVSAVLKTQGKRFFHGIVKSFVRGARGTHATAYRLEIVPSFWLLSQRTQSRIFQQISVPDILKKVLQDLDADFELVGDFQPRDYCVQYRESDFAFASRIMEEEGIFYFFRHNEDGHQLVIANSSQSHEELPFDSKLFYDDTRGGIEDDEIIYSWEKQQILKPGKITLWDHCFELPHKSLDVQELVDEDLQIGEVAHKLRVAGNDKLELYDFPGGYAQRFDGIAPSGSERAADLQKIYDDNARTAKIRMRQETAGAIQITGHTACLNIIPGFRFALGRHYSDDDVYVITSASVNIPQAGSYAADEGGLGLEPEIVFNCIPLKLPFSPHRITPKPVLYGTQTALVVGPAGEEIFTDKYGRVKVQFFWDRDGKFDGNSSCWVRVASPWAGKHWGMIHIPRIGQEVVVAFEEGDPDQPIIVGSVYNADQMPPHELPANKTQSGIKSRSTPNAGSQNLNEIRFEDKIGHEHIFIHGEKDVHFRCKGGFFGDVGGTYNMTVHAETNYEHFAQVSRLVHADETLKVDGRYGLIVDADMLVKCGAAAGIKGKSLRLGSDTDLTVTSNSDTGIDAGGAMMLSASSGLYLTAAGCSIALTSAGVYISGPMVYLNSGSADGMVVEAAKPRASGPNSPAGPLKPGETQATENRAGSAPATENSHNENAEENKDKTHWIEVELKDDAGSPVIGETCEITLPNGRKAIRSTDRNGLIRVERIDPGECKIRWINLDQDAVEPQ
jgi:type VI secretion system secreted protein VgrG